MSQSLGLSCTEGSLGSVPRPLALLPSPSAVRTRSAGCTPPRSMLPLPFEISCRVARELKARDLVCMEAALYGRGNAPQLWDHVSQPLKKAFPRYVNFRQIPICELVMQGLDPQDQVCLSVRERELFRQIVEPLGRETPLFTQLADSKTTLVSKQILRVISAVKAAGREALIQKSISKEQQLMVSRELLILAEINRKQPLSLQESAGSTRVLEEVLNDLTFLSRQIMPSPETERSKKQILEAMHEIDRLGHLFTYIEKAFF